MEREYQSYTVYVSVTLNQKHWRALLPRVKMRDGLNVNSVCRLLICLYLCAAYYVGMILGVGKDVLVYFYLSLSVFLYECVIMFLSGSV